MEDFMLKYILKAVRYLTIIIDILDAVGAVLEEKNNAAPKT